MGETNAFVVCAGSVRHCDDVSATARNVSNLRASRFHPSPCGKQQFPIDLQSASCALGFEGLIVGKLVVPNSLGARKGESPIGRASM